MGAGADARPSWLVGMLIIVLNYLGLLPGGASNGYLLLGLGLITSGSSRPRRYR